MVQWLRHHALTAKGLGSVPAGRSPPLVLFRVRHARTRGRLQEVPTLESFNYSIWLRGKESAYDAGDIGDLGWIPRLGRSPGGGHGNPLQYSCLESPMDSGAWRATVQRVAKSWIRLSTRTCARTHTHTHTHTDTRGELTQSIEKRAVWRLDFGPSSASDWLETSGKLLNFCGLGKGRHGTRFGFSDHLGTPAF